MSIDSYKKEVGLMKLEKLTAEREGISSKPFRIPVGELLARFEQLYTGAISDVMREFCLLDQALPGYLQPLRLERTVAALGLYLPDSRFTGTHKTTILKEMKAAAA